MKGIITDIQRFSLNDGPGIRTTVFLKGCNMACAWCHNPETINIMPQLMYYRENCINCLKCVEVCPTGAQNKVEDTHMFSRELCINCGKCAKVCFPGALVMSGKEMEIEDVMDEILQDLDYYKNSGGGITLSGGEVFVQAEYAYELLKKCKENGIQTAIETNLSAPWEKMIKLLEITDIVMLDIKLIDSKQHEIWTRVGNKGILENIKKLSEKGIPMIIRTPVIPDVNDSIDCIEQICNFISDYKENILYYELLNFNPLGDFKYKGLNIKNVFAEKKPHSEAKMNELADVARKYGFKVKIG